MFGELKLDQISDEILFLPEVLHRVWCLLLNFLFWNSVSNHSNSCDYTQKYNKKPNLHFFPTLHKRVYNSEKYKNDFLKFYIKIQIFEVKVLAEADPNFAK
jgi:hypothetical protein